MLCNKILNGMFSMIVMPRKSRNIDPKSTIGIALALAEEKGWNDSEFANRIGISPQTFHNWTERGNIPAINHERVADVLNCSVDRLLNRDHKLRLTSSFTQRMYDRLAKDEKIYLHGRMHTFIEEIIAGRTSGEGPADPNGAPIQ
jgi:DNA-binding Xre family transcriptional regulator